MTCTEIYKHALNTIIRSVYHTTHGVIAHILKTTLHITTTAHCVYFTSFLSPSPINLQSSR